MPVSFMYVTYPLKELPEKTPVELEAVFVESLYKEMKALFPEQSTGVLSPYSAQVRQLKRTSIPQENVRSVDGYQGEERDIIIVSIGLASKKTGFLGDSRRTCVCLTRAKKLLIVVVNNGLGDEFCHSTSNLVGQNWWAFYKRILQRLNKECYVPLTTQSKITDCVDKVKSMLFNKMYKDRTDVEQVFQSNLCQRTGSTPPYTFFKDYQSKNVGALESLHKIEDSEGEDMDRDMLQTIKQKTLTQLKSEGIL